MESPAFTRPLSSPKRKSAEGGRRQSLCVLYRSRPFFPSILYFVNPSYWPDAKVSKPKTSSSIVASSFWRGPMLDLVYLALGLGAFALLGLYAVTADRL